MNVPQPATRRLQTSLATEWRELGWTGRVALVGIGLSVVIAVILGLWIPRETERHILHARADLLEAIAADLSRSDAFPLQPDPVNLEQFDREVRFRLLGGDTVRVKVWQPDGTITYSDASDLIGRRFELTEPARRAFDGEVSTKVSDLSEPAHELDRDLGALIEFYVPVADESGAVAVVFEVEQQAESLVRTISNVRRNVWLSIAVGLGVLTVFMGTLAVAGARAANRRRRQAEDLLGDLLAAQDEERRRIVGALHDDIGQPLYRLLYGLEGSRHRVRDERVADELQHLQDVVRDVDQRLRAELRHLYTPAVDDVGLAAALAELVATTERESDLDIELDVDLPRSPTGTAATALFRTAQEGLFNVRKHSGAHSAHVRLSTIGERAVLEVEDDGSGLAGVPGLGLATTRDRLDAIGGGLDVVFRRGRGTLLRAWVPLNGEDPR